MRRRTLLGLLSASLWPGLSRGQSASRVTRVGLVSLVLSEGSDLRWWEPFFARMRENGYQEGQTVQYLTTRADGRPELLEESVAELMSQRPEVLITTGIRETRAASRAAPSTPVISLLVPDAVEAGLAASLTRPGGNVTGLNTAGPEIEVKRLELLREVLSQARRLAVLGSAGQQASADQRRIRAAQEAAQALGIEVLFFDSTAQRDSLEGAFAAMRSAGVEGVSVLDAAEFWRESKLVAEVALKHRMPTIFGLREHVIDGGLAGYTPRIDGLQARAADYAMRVLRGEAPGELPIERPTSFEFLVNLQAAKALGLAISLTFLARADEVIE